MDFGIAQFQHMDQFFEDALFHDELDYHFAIPDGLAGDIVASQLHEAFLEQHHELINIIHDSYYLPYTTPQHLISTYSALFHESDEVEILNSNSHSNSNDDIDFIQNPFWDTGPKSVTTSYIPEEPPGDKTDLLTCSKIDDQLPLHQIYRLIYLDEEEVDPCIGKQNESTPIITSYIPIEPSDVGKNLSFSHESKDVAAPAPIIISFVSPHESSFDMIYQYFVFDRGKAV